VQGESGTISSGVVGVDFPCGFRFTGAEGMKKFLRLEFQLFEVRMLAHPPGGRRATQVSPFLFRPVSASSGRKEFSDAIAGKDNFRSTQSFPRTWRRSEGTRNIIELARVGLRRSGLHTVVARGQKSLTTLRFQMPVWR